MDFGRISSGWRLALAPLAASLAACSVDPADYTTDADTGSTHALVTVERSDTLDGTASAGAIAGFARLPAVVDDDSALRLVGLGLDLPAVNQCQRRMRDDLAPSAPSGPVEFLAAGDVSIAADHVRTILAPRALPTIPDLISGVVYTTRDQEAAPLPTGATYRVVVSGGPLIAPFRVDAGAPAPIEAVTVGGMPLAEVQTISVDQPLDLTWSVGNSDDLVYVEMSTSISTTGCTFRDDIGFGTIPAGTFDGRGDGRLGLRRIHTEQFAASGLERGELRFDFELALGVEFKE